MFMGCLIFRHREQARSHIGMRTPVGASLLAMRPVQTLQIPGQNCLHPHHPVKCRSPRFARGQTMSQSIDIAVIGATGTVGETLVQILEERDFPIGTLHLLASSESAGSSVMFRGKSVRVREVDEFDFSKVQLAFFAAGPAVSLSFASRATDAGCSVIDLSGALPAEKAPQVVPEANAQVLAGLKKPFQVSSP